MTNFQNQVPAFAKYSAEPTAHAFFVFRDYDGLIARGQIFHGEKAPVPVAGGLAFQSVSAGESHVCGVTTGSVPYCWGYNWAGQLGHGTPTQRNQPKLVSGGRPFRQISAGTAHSCRTTLGNVAFCWGVRSSPTPVRMGGPN